MGQPSSDASGIRTVNVEPRPGSLRTSTSPRRLRARFRQVDRQTDELLTPLVYSTERSVPTA